MVRTSELKLVQEKENYETLLPKYLSLLETLKKEFPVKNVESYSNLVNFKTNKEIPRHNWFEYKQGYSEQLIVQILEKEKPSKKAYVLDPFTGVGTTNLVAQTMGFKSIGFDINPVATFAAEVKTTYFDDKQIEKIRKLLRDFNPRKKSLHTPDSPLLEKSFDKQIFDKLMNIKGFYESIDEPIIQSLFKLAYLNIIEDCSNRVKDGNGIKIVKNKQPVEDVFSYYTNVCHNMIEDINHINRDKESIIINGSMLLNNNFNHFKNKKVGIVIFSPPYANCFDYCEVYKLELWMGDFVKSYDDFKLYRNMALRSHVNSVFDHCIENPNWKVNIVADLISCFNIWNKNIPDMIRGYFDDMIVMFEKLHHVMIEDAKCYIVVANSGYKGILVPTDLLLADIAESKGFKVIEIIQARKIRASSQQMEVLNNEYDNLMRESVIVLERK